MNDESVQAALVLLHRQNTFLYFHIFIKPQAPLDCVNGIVRFSCSQQWRFGGFLSQVCSVVERRNLRHKELQTLFIPGFYQPSHAIKLFCHNFTIAPLSHKIQQSKPSSKEFTSTCDSSAIMNNIVKMDNVFAPTHPRFRTLSPHPIIFRHSTPRCEVQQ